MTNVFSTQTRNDPLCGFFRWGSKLFEITNHHIYIVQGEIDAGLLRQALRRTVEQFEILRDLCLRDSKHGAIQESDGAIYTLDTPHPLSFESGAFRKTLMDFVASTEPGGLVRTPVRVHLAYSENRNQTCVHLGISHDVADVKSGNIVMARLMEEYAALRGAPGADAAQPPAADKRFYEHHPLSRIQPGWFSSRAVIKRKARANLSIAKRMLSSERTWLGSVDGDKEGNPSAGSAGNDFYHLILPESLQKNIHEAARRHGVTVNTLFSGALVGYIERHQARKSSPAVYTVAVSLRKLIESSYYETFRSYMVDCTLKIARYLDKRERLRTIENEMAAIRNGRLELELGRMESAIPLFHDPVPRRLAFWIMERTQGTNILYSNPGVIEESFSFFGTDDLPILDTLTFGCLVHPYDIMFLTPTINGRMQLDIVYRRHRFSDIQKQFVAPFLEELDGIIDLA